MAFEDHYKPDIRVTNGTPSLHYFADKEGVIGFHCDDKIDQMMRDFIDNDRIEMIAIKRVGRSLTEFIKQPKDES